MARRWRWNELSERLPADRPIAGAEIGVLKGQMAAEMLRRCPLLTLHLVDSWAVVAPDSEYAKSGDHLARADAARMAAARRQCEQAVAFAGGRAIIHCGDSMEMAAEIEGESLDYVFIDADHSFYGCTRDLRAWYPKVKPGGLIGGHDYGQTRYRGFGVTEAVDTFLKMKPETGSDHTWFAVKR